MSSKYVEIPLDEMKSFLESSGFIMWKRDPKTEWIANKIFAVENINYVIRVYTTINPDDTSRGVGSDAIRVGVFSSDGRWMFGSKRVNRTKNWKNSINNRIEEIQNRLIEQNKNYIVNLPNI